MDILELLTKKRHGCELTTEELSFFASGAADGSIPDYQLSALLMAICLVGMSSRETSDLTTAMAHSGQMLDLSQISGFKVDKHSTGGVGDKTTLVVCPIVAACGIPVAKLSGRGLGYTGGTLDKLESIPGFSVRLSQERFFSQMEKIGLCIAGQTGEIAPADKRLYALRDVTATVDSLPLIASSIMSKKIASGADGLVLDVKFGNGAFMKTSDMAKELALQMLDIGHRNGKICRAVLSSMEQPLGNAVGNALEVREAIETLQGHGPEDFRHLCLTLSGQMLLLAGICDGESVAENALNSGAALDKFAEMVQAQGGNPNVISQRDLLPAANHFQTVFSPADGFISGIHAEKIGLASCALGAGRIRKENSVDPSAGLILLKKVGAHVQKGEPVATLYSSEIHRFSSASDLVQAAFSFSQNQPKVPRLISEILVGTSCLKKN